MNQIVVRRSQVEKEIAKIHEQNKKKSQRDYKSHEAFVAWQDRQQRKLDDLYGELAILDYPEGYYEIPLAVAASELGLTLSEVSEIAGERLLQLTYEGMYRLGSRITRR